MSLIPSVIPNGYSKCSFVNMLAYVKFLTLKIFQTFFCRAFHGGISFIFVTITEFSARCPFLFYAQITLRALLATDGNLVEK